MRKLFLKHPNLFLFLTGALATLALPPISILPLMVLSLAFLVHRVSAAQSAREAFAHGAWWGMGYFAVGLYWVSYSLSVDWARFWFYLPLSALGLPALMAFYTGAAAWAVHVTANRISPILKCRPSRLCILTFPIFWTAAELLRGHFFTGYPWNLTGSAFTDVAVLFQSAAVVGIYGLGFIMAVMAALLALACAHVPFRRTALMGITVILIVMVSYGHWRMNAEAQGSKTVRVRVVQPNVPQSEKWQSDLRRQSFETLLDLSSATDEDAPDLIIWPEAATPYILSQQPKAAAAIARRLPASSVLLAGTLRQDAETKTYFNSIEFLTKANGITGHYDKHHLVPFGEYVPFSRYIPIPAIANLFGDMGRGDGAKTITTGGVRISPLICYEAIFPGEVTAHGAAQPQLLVNVTDDSWFGDTRGPVQHLATARARAVEEGLPLIRAANTGVSAIIDRFGNVVDAMPYGAQGILNMPISIATNPVPPPAAHGRFHVWLGLMVLAYAAAAILIVRKFP